MKEVTFGQYYPVSSFVHKMDARVKILLSIAYIVAVFLIKEFFFWGFAVATAFLSVFAIVVNCKCVIVKYHSCSRGPAA